MKSFVFQVAIKPDKFEDGRDAWRASCPALEGGHTWATVIGKHARISARPWIFMFRTFSNPGKKFR
jgi:hypothetical protein